MTAFPPIASLLAALAPAPAAMPAVAVETPGEFLDVLGEVGEADELPAPAPKEKSAEEPNLAAAAWASVIAATPVEAPPVRVSVDVTVRVAPTENPDAADREFEITAPPIVESAAESIAPEVSRAEASPAPLRLFSALEKAPPLTVDLPVVRNVAPPDVRRAVSKYAPVASTELPAGENALPVSEDAMPAVEGAPAVAGDTEPVVEIAPAVVEDVAPAVEIPPAVMEDLAPVVERAPAVTDDARLSKDDALLSKEEAQERPDVAQLEPRQKDRPEDVRERFGIALVEDRRPVVKNATPTAEVPVEIVEDRPPDGAAPPRPFSVRRPLAVHADAAPQAPRPQLAFAARLRPVQEVEERVTPQDAPPEVERREIKRPAPAPAPSPEPEASERGPVDRPATDRRIDWAQPAHVEEAPESATEEPAAPSKIAPPPRRETPLPAPVARDIRLEVASPDRKVEVRLVERGGEVQLSVRTPDERLADGLREQLPQLSSRLQESGFRSDEWRAATASGSERRLDVQAAASGSTDTRQQGQRNGGGEERREQQPHAPREAGEPRHKKEKGSAFSWLMQSLR